MENELRFPWEFVKGGDPLDDYVYLRDCDGNDIFTCYAVQSGARVKQMRHILQSCTPADAPVSAETREEEVPDVQQL